MAATPTSTQIEIGGETVTVGRFSVYKAIHAGDLLAEVMNSIPDLTEKISTFSEEFRSKNTVKITRAAAELRFDPEQLAKVSPEAWESGGGVIEMPATPTPLDMAGYVFPYAWKHARDRVVELLALLLLSNRELEEADREGNVAEVIDSAKKRLIHSDLDELLDLMTAGAEVLGEQFSGKVGKLRAALVTLGIFPTEEEEEKEKESPTSTTKTPKSITSSGSPEPSDGLGASVSTDSPSTPQPVSSTG